MSRLVRPLLVLAVLLSLAGSLAACNDLGGSTNNAFQRVSNSIP